MNVNADLVNPFVFRNFALETIVERFRSAAKAAVAIRCGYCKPPAADATKSCLDCQVSQAYQVFVDFSLLKYVKSTKSS